MALDEREFRLAMSHFTSGVTIVTTRDEGQVFGMTVASFASLSLRPPLILVCLDEHVQTNEAIRRSGHFGVSILAADQSALSSRFASRVDDRFAGVEIRHGSLGDPLIDGALTLLECRLEATLPGGDHTIFVGEVVEALVREGEPLAYFRSNYRDLAP